MHESTDQTTDHFHAEKFGQFPEAPDDNNSDKNIDCDRSANQFIHVVKQNGDQNDVDDIGNLKIDKIQKIQSVVFEVKYTFFFLAKINHFFVHLKTFLNCIASL